MKKIISLLLTVFTVATLSCFANDDKKDGKMILIQESYYQTGKFHYGDRNSDITDPIFIQNLGIEAGFFRSMEDGLLDWIGINSFGFQIGPAILDNSAIPHTVDFNLSSKNSIGLQLNFFLCSIGCTCGLRSGYEFTSSDPLNYLENKVFLDFMTLPYFSVNLGGLIKIMVQYENTLPILRFRFRGDNLEERVRMNVDWFGNDDVTHSVKAGVVLFL